MTSGARTAPPGNYTSVAAYVLTAAGGTAAGPASALAGAGLLAQRALDRGRLAGWEAEWGTTGPPWTGHQH